MGAPPDKTWPQEDTDYVTENYHVIAVGKIADYLGRTKSAVIGMAHRLGLSVSREEISRRMAEGMNRGKPERPKRKRKRKAVSHVKPPQPPPPMVVSPKGITLLSLRDGQCRFPIGRKKVRVVDVKHDLTAFCGQAVDNGCVYCGQHMAVAYDRVRTRNSNLVAYQSSRWLEKH